MSKADLEEWFSEQFWPLYLELVKTPAPTKYKAGSRGDALSKVLKEKYSQELRERIIDALRAQIKHRNDMFRECGSMQAYNERTAYDKFYCNRNGRTWLNQLGWEDEIPSIEYKEVSFGDLPDKCTEEGCSKPVHGPHEYCAYHYSMKHGTMVDELRDYYAKHCKRNPDESKKDYLKRMREDFRKNATGIGS